MTNGEKLKEIFPSVQITECESYVQVMGENYEFSNTYPLKWWNAEYKEPTTKVDCEHTDCNNCVNHKYCDYESNKSEIPTGSTTKNDLVVIGKIRAEIEAIIGEHNLDDYDFCSGLICARKIIDKYKAESEG